MGDIKTAADIAVRKCLGVKPDERVLIVTDEAHRDMSYTIFDAAKIITEYVTILEMSPREFHGEEPPPFVAKIMSNFDAEFLVTSKSLSHTTAARTAIKKGARIASMPTITKDTFVRTMNVDYFKVKNITEKLGKIFDRASLIEVKTKIGTDIKFPIFGIRALRDSGFLQRPGDLGNLPAGEACIRPEDNKANGVIVFDGMFHEVGVLKNPLKTTISNGFCMSLDGKEEARKLKKILCNFGDKKIGRNNPACCFGKFGIGTNFAAILSGNPLENEKIYKTVNFAFGNNIMLGGSNDVGLHIAGIIKEPSVWIDGKQLMNEGEFLI